MSNETPEKKKLVVLRGIQRSGKTQVAMSLLSEVPNCVRISKDDIRELMRKGLPWNKKDEHIVLEAEKLLLRLAFEQNKNIIIDDTNLNIKHVSRYKDLAMLFGYEFKVITLKANVYDSVQKDSIMINRVGRDVIFNTAFKYGFGHQDTEFVIYDLDGTLTDNSDRLHLATKNSGEIDKEILYDQTLVSFDDPKRSVKSLLMSDFECGYEIFIISDRPERTRKTTEDWLNRNEIPWNRLILRPDDQELSEIEFKKYAIFNLTDTRFCLRIIEDNEEIIQMCETLGLNTFDINTGVVT
jgi:predicted kinase